MKYLFAVLGLFCALTGFAQQNGKRVLMEYVTSAGCPGCAWGSYVRDSVLRDHPEAIVVAIHRADAAHPDSMGCADVDSMLGDYLWAHPTAMFDRVLWSDFPKVCVTTNQWDSRLSLREQAPVPATIGGNTVYDSITRNLSVTVNGAILWDLDQDVRINAYIIEDSVRGHGVGYDQLNNTNNSPSSPLFGAGDPIENYVHKNVVRDMLAGHRGLAGVIPTPVASGTYFSHTFQTTLDPKWDDGQVYVVVMVQRHDPDPEKREVYNANRIGLNASVLAAAGEPLTLPGYPRFELYPNPVTSTATLILPEHDHWSVRMMDMSGHVLRRYRVQADRLLVDAGNLASGVYYLEVHRGEGYPRMIPFFVP